MPDVGLDRVNSLSDILTKKMLVDFYPGFPFDLPIHFNELNVLLSKQTMKIHNLVQTQLLTINVGSIAVAPGL